jgi:hypothetical protein
MKSGTGIEKPASWIANHQSGWLSWHLRGFVPPVTPTRNSEEPKYLRKALRTLPLSLSLQQDEMLSIWLYLVPLGREQYMDFRLLLYKGCLEQWGRERGLTKVSTAYPPSFYMSPQRSTISSGDAPKFPE